MLVYVREAHPTDGWKYSGWSHVEDPITLLERKNVAAKCRRDFLFDFTTVVDTMDDRTAQRWSAWPERIFVVSRQGLVVYTGDQGPFGFNPASDFPGYLGGPKRGIDLDSFLKAYLPIEGITVFQRGKSPDLMLY